MCCRSDFPKVSDRLPCCLSKSRVKREFLDTCLTTFFGVHNFQNTSAMRFIFLEKCSKRTVDLKYAKKSLSKELFFLIQLKPYWLS